MEFRDYLLKGEVAFGLESETFLVEIESFTYLLNVGRYC